MIGKSLPKFRRRIFNPFFDMLPFGQEVDVLNSSGRSYERGIIVGKSHMRPLKYDVLIAGGERLFSVSENRLWAVKQ